MKNFSYEVFKHRLIYVYAIPDAAHRSLLKIGETTISTDLPVKKLSPNSSELNAAANARIKECTNTAGVAFKLLHTELAVTDKNKSFHDGDVHDVLIRSGVEKKSPAGTTAREWFKTDLPTAIQAIAAVKHGKKFLAGLKSKKFRAEIILRPEQERAVARTVKYFGKKTHKKFLWYAKMRFGKTLCALEVVKRMKFAKTIIVTHRPVVSENWFDEYQKIFGDNNFGSKTRGETIKTLLKRGKNFVYFASIQDLRGSEKFNKNDEIFGETWDFVIVDEAHEGTQTEIGKKVIADLVKPATKVLELSGTPFNLIDDYTEENSFTWDYVMEQRAKNLWAINHGDDPNPYADLPKMNIYTYDLGKLIGKSYLDLFDKAFNFREFFRTNKAGKFVHAADVKNFLDLLVKPDDNNYPFSRPEFCDMFRHTLWMVPGVREGRALSAMLKDHRVFCNFGIVNVAGDGDEDEESADALEMVQDAIAEFDYTITISCGKLTTGVTVPQWTAVLYLAGSNSTSAMSYLQTIFRVQTPCNENGVSKQNCYVFDFAPDRTLKMVTAAAAVSVRAGQTDDEQRERLGAFLNFCPVISLTGSRMKEFNADKLLQQLKSVYAERAVRNGFDDRSLYKDNLLKLTDVEWKKFDELKGIIGAGNKTIPKPSSVTVNKNGMDDEQYDGETTRRQQRELTDEERELQRQRQVKRNAISILRGISIRMPLLIYGAKVEFDEDFTLEMFTNEKIIDDDSWAEFMPAGVTREKFKYFTQYYDEDVFVEAGRRVRNLAKAADKLTPTERVKEIANLFATFKNPDKETVLTPWRVVNLHMTEVFGGWNFFAEDNPPQFVPTEIFRADKKILEINSKTGLYPLFVAYSIYRARLESEGISEETAENIDEDRAKHLNKLQKFWDKTVAENVFVICKTKMAETITRRTLMGYRDEKIANAECYDNLIYTLKNDSDAFIECVTNKNFWFKGGGKMFFDAVVGNPPYQNTSVGDNKNYTSPVYHLFMDAAFKVADKVSLITPARFLFNAGDTPTEFNQRVLADSHFKVVHYETDGRKFFPTSEIKAGVAITLRDATKNFGAIGLFIPFEELFSILEKVGADKKNFRSLNEIVRTPVAYRLSEKFFAERRELTRKLQKADDSALRTNIFERLPEIFLDKPPADNHKYIQILGRLNNRRVYKFVRRAYITDENLIDRVKIFLNEANGTGAFGETLTEPFVVDKGIGSTQTFMTVGAFDTRDEAEACLKYIKTKFARALLGILKVTQHNPPSTWAKVPLQNFTASSDIDWTKSVAQIDAELYRKYGLTDAEKNFIETHVKEMS